MAEIIDNLGGYGQFTSAANSLIRSLEKTAVSNAAPGLRAQGGAVLGVLGTCGLLGAVGGLHHWHNQSKQAKSATQETARNELRTALNAEVPQQTDHYDEDAFREESRVDSSTLLR